MDIRFNYNPILIFLFNISQGFADFYFLAFYNVVISFLYGVIILLAEKNIDLQNKKKQLVNNQAFSIYQKYLIYSFEAGSFV